MDKARRNVAVLAGCQGLLLVNNSILVTVNGLAGYLLASDKALATLPVTMYYLGSALTTLPMSFLMKHAGRRTGFTVGGLCGVVGSVICAVAMYEASFWLLCAGTLVLGIYFAAGQYYRFAAADATPFDFRSRAISLVLAGGIIGGFIGPATSRLTKDLIASHVYAGSYFSLVTFALLAIVILRGLDIPPCRRQSAKLPGGRCLRSPGSPDSSSPCCAA